MFNSIDPDEIIPNLYLGSIEAACDSRLLQSLGINIIIQVLEDPRECRVFDQFQYYQIRIGDWPTANITKYLPNAIRFIHRNLNEGKKIFVHCVAGVSRSATIVIAYMMALRKWEYEEAIKYVRSKRSRVAPNNGFEMQLRCIEKEMLYEALEF
ncbi:unnamed protein product [Blepharisma stoltei]|uniref:protein-tyrosine-phosphatase n=1 Tax=Blepharisma stoltei TaxID=1481888 RepID=A0AAU9JNY1_9CILI|nr:unnamed protein product [Blepharisma stoltei]